MLSEKPHVVVESFCCDILRFSNQLNIDQNVTSNKLNLIPIKPNILIIPPKLKTKVPQLFLS